MPANLRRAFEITLIVGAPLIALLFIAPTETVQPPSAPPTENKPIFEVPNNIQSKRYATNESVTEEYTGYKPAKSFQGFTIYPEVGTELVHVINMSGNSVHNWPLDAARATLLPDCSLLVVHGTKWGLKQEPWATLRSKLRRYSWTGDILWEYSRKDEPFHHDIAILPNGNLVGVQRVLVPETNRPVNLRPALQGVKIRSDELFEITPDGEEVWSWRFHEHLDLNSCGAFQCQKLDPAVASGRKAFDWTHINSVKPLPENKWFDQGDARFRPGNLLIMARNWSTVLLIDKQSGAIVWRFSGDYKGGLQYGHEAFMIEPHLPGAGNILLFDNGVLRQESAILEIEPPTGQVVWSYDKGKAFFSAAAGSVQRLPNGNTLISEDLSGRVFEVTPEKEIVWLYEGSQIRSARATRYPQTACQKLQSLPVEG